MNASVLIVITILSSWYAFGLLRTAFWTLPCLFIPPPFSFWAVGSILSFTTAASVLMPFRKGAYDLRDTGRDRIFLIFFLSGLLNGLLFYRVDISSLWAMITGAAFPLLFTRLCGAFRWPISSVYYVPRWTRWGLTILWILSWLSLWISEKTLL